VHLVLRVLRVYLVSLGLVPDDHLKEVVDHFL